MCSHDLLCLSLEREDHYAQVYRYTDAWKVLDKTPLKVITSSETGQGEQEWKKIHFSWCVLYFFFHHMYVFFILIKKVKSHTKVNPDSL